ncbi:hypothetical protein CC86DRAFT_437475 [Ophiobolus disseminans]|uniref:Stress response protein NST1 n=1 Tax=Ophiobolus disseminans TaxID=1469910 RepID=A0A6A7A4S6_9PLEO|nr:hypothetical protein CC86DRAFT_437475 [Ophiobolus disseminans]
MAQGTRGPAMSPNGTGTAAHPPAPSAVNRKKQKRREKEAARKAAHEPEPESPAPSRNGVSSGHSHLPASAAHARQPTPQYAEDDLDEGPYDDEDNYYSDEEVEHYEHAYANGHYQQGYAHAPLPDSSSKKPRRKKKGASAPPPLAYTQHVAPRHSPAPSHSVSRSGKKDRIWNTSTAEERERIREFWLSLGEDDRKSLVKIEKEAVLRKMKEQQKHSCSCSVCGRKRTAIEEELEVLYDAYYEELEQYAHHQQDVGRFLPDANFGHASSAPHPRPLMNTHPPPGHYDEDEEEEEEYSDEAEEHDYSDSEISSDREYDSERSLAQHHEATDFLHFGNSLQVKGGILTVADDLLKNDGKKFIEMMEQLAERRMAREEEAHQQYPHPNVHPRTYSAHAQPPIQQAPDEYDDGSVEDDEEGFDDEDYEEDEEDEDEAMTEEQRMEEGRRMFQIFAARMFEQRVLQAYREKVAAERQARLLEELAEEDEKKDLKEAKKAKEAQKRKEKKDKQKQAKAEEKAKRDAEIAAKEAELKAAEEKRLEEQRKKRDEQRKKKEAERKAQEEEKQRKEAERQKRQQDERERQQESERKAREQKAVEKKAKDDAKRKEREDREAKEKEAREKKAHDEKERRDRETRAKADKDRIRKDEQATAAAQTPGPRKASQTVAPALPPQLLKQNSSSGMPSPHVTPAVPKAPTPSRPRQTSQHGSHGSSPKTPQVAPGTNNATSPTSRVQLPVMPKSILTKPQAPQQPNHVHHGQPASPMPPIGPPPGMQGPPGLNMGNMPPGLNGFHAQGSMMPNMMGPRVGMPPFFPPQAGPQSFRGFPPPGMSMPMPRGFPMDGPPGLGPMPGFPGPNGLPSFGMGMPTHSRQGSGSFERLSSMESPITAPSSQPIQRPAPIQRPSSVKPSEENRRRQGADVDDLAAHLGSKALLDDEEDIPEIPERRPSVPHHGSMRNASIGFGYPDAPPSLQTSYGGFGGSTTGSIWGTPPLNQFPSAGAPWGNSPTSGFFGNPLSMNTPRVYERGANEQRLVWLRRMVCSACKMLTARQSTPDGYVDASEVHHQVDTIRNPLEPAIAPDEIKEACDIIDGTSTNGGGSLEYKQMGDGRLSHIRFVDTQGPPPTLGEIGSPVPGHSMPVAGFGGRFPGLGPQGF